MANVEEIQTTNISKWGPRKTGTNAYGQPCAMKQVVIKHKLGFKTKKGKTAYRSETRHLPA